MQSSTRGKIIGCLCKVCRKARQKRKAKLTQANRRLRRKNNVKKYPQDPYDGQVGFGYPG